MARTSKQLTIGKIAEHLVCVDLMHQGYNAFLTDQGLPYDVVVEVDGVLKRVQVKSSENQKNLTSYRFKVGSLGGRSKAVRDPSEVDYFAFVAVDRGAVSYSTTESLLSHLGAFPAEIRLALDNFTRKLRDAV